jgi:DNA repair photolyase
MVKISDEFEKQDRHKLLLLTKSGNVKLLVDKPRKQTIFSFSLNANEVWKRWEHKTPSPVERIKAAKTSFEMGNEVRVRIDPIFPIENWQMHYEDLIYSMLSEFTPERITLGTPRGLAKTLMFSQDLTWAKYFTEKPEHSGWGKKIPDFQRKEIYLFFYDKLCALGFNKSKITMCKETTLMWTELGLNPFQIKCNCVW